MSTKPENPWDSIFRDLVRTSGATLAIVLVKSPERGRGIMIHGSKIDLVPMPETLRRVAAELEKSIAGEASSAIVFEPAIEEGPAGVLRWLDEVEAASVRLLANPVTDEEGARAIVAAVRAAGAELRTAIDEVGRARELGAVPDTLLDRARAAGDAFEATASKLIPLVKRRLS